MTTTIKFRFLPARALSLCLAALALLTASARSAPAPFNVVAFYTGKEDPAHISFDHEANRWFPIQGETNGFTYTATTNWADLNAAFLARYQVVLFLDTRPEAPEQRRAFEQYMKHGGAWIGFHFSAFALTPSAVPQNWDWYHNEFLGCGQYVSNTWRPTAAVLRVENSGHPFTKGLPATFDSAPNEWYRWSNDLRTNADIRILLSIDPASFPLGTGPKPEEIWHAGYYPVAWTNVKYRMLYLNMGHNDMDYDRVPHRELSATFASPEQDRFLLNALLRLGRGEK